MSRAVCFFAVQFVCLAFFSQEQTVKITPVVQSAVIYLDGAELYQNKQVTLNAGYSVKYPRNKSIQLKKYRKATRAKF